MIIDWKKVAKNIYENLKKEIKRLKNKPKLVAILVWDNSSSLRYIAQKEKWAKYIWINFELIHFDKNITQKELEKKIISLNNDDLVSWFIVQLPLPKHLKENEIINLINPDKDVDWFHPINQWKVVLWDENWLKPCTPAWIIEMLDFYNIEVKWKNICVIWRSNIVWKPITNMLINRQASVTSCNSLTKDIKYYTKNSDIIISAVWVPKLINKDLVWDKKTIIIDVWFSIIEWNIFWDVDFEELINLWHDVSPVPWWVWSLTVAVLMKNTLKAHKIKNISINK